LNPRYERWRYITFGITWLVYVSYYLTRKSFSVAKVALGKDPNVAMSREQMGLVDSAYLTTYSLGQFVFGALADRFGARRILLVGMTLSVLTALVNGFASLAWVFVVCGVLQGLAQSTGWTATNKAMSAWFSLKERGRVLGWWCTHYTAGAAIAGPFAGYLMYQFGHKATVDGQDTIVSNWPAAYWGAAAALGIVTILMWVLLRNRPEDVGLPPVEKYHGEPESRLDDEERGDIAPEGSWKLLGEVLSSPSIWLIAIAYFPVKLTRYALDFWGPSLVNDTLGTSPLASSITSAWMPIGGLAGVVLAGYFSDRVFQSRRAPVIVLCLLTTAALMIIGLFPIQNIWYLRVFFLLVGAFLYGGDSLLAAATAIDFGTKRGAGASVGLVNGIGSMGAILGGYLPGVLTTEHDWSKLFWTMLCGLLVSALLLIPLWRHKPPTA
jgi:OPA family sugar phosphate sensor protein UhpC-like MFS transporter